eukprot:TRINITY_DN2313_c2_g1_i1.p1 TRINITY_DN2313_c2_g1~~TRINITY_DN2313_c2_g1_i1.p1  ORF type:complete len:433 (+),score=114.06 TRINITY_DN2313_c2_g1_i1:22-1299(+)
MTPSSPLDSPPLSSSPVSSSADISSRLSTSGTTTTTTNSGTTTVQLLDSIRTQIFKTTSLRHVVNLYETIEKFLSIGILEFSGQDLFHPSHDQLIPEALQQRIFSPNLNKTDEKKKTSKVKNGDDSDDDGDDDDGETKIGDPNNAGLSIAIESKLLRVVRKFLFRICYPTKLLILSNCLDLDQNFLKTPLSPHLTQLGFCDVSDYPNNSTDEPPRHSIDSRALTMIEHEKRESEEKEIQERIESSQLLPDQLRVEHAYSVYKLLISRQNERERIAQEKAKKKSYLKTEGDNETPSLLSSTSSSSLPEFSFPTSELESSYAVSSISAFSALSHHDQNQNINTPSNLSFNNQNDGDIFSRTNSVRNYNNPYGNYIYGNNYENNTDGNNYGNNYGNNPDPFHEHQDFSFMDSPSTSYHRRQRDQSALF